MTKPSSKWVRWFIRPLLSFVILEVGLSFAPIPDWWEAGVFNEYLYSNKIRKTLFSSGEYNTLGYRDSEWMDGDGTQKIAFLGDSRTYGLFVKKEHTYAHQIEQLSDWEGMNLGIPGATTFEGLNSLIPDALPYQPTASVVCLDLNSSLISYLPRAKSGGRDDIINNILRSSSVWMFLEGFWHAVFSERVSVIPLEEYGQQLNLIFQTLEDHGVSQNILLVGWTPLENYPNLYTQELYNQYREVSREVARARNIPIIEFTEELKNLSLSEAYVGEHQIHLSQESHRKIAHAILRILHES
jgi:lysophospholipase L1-like esterase